MTRPAARIAEIGLRRPRTVLALWGLVLVVGGFFALGLDRSVVPGGEAASNSQSSVVSRELGNVPVPSLFAVVNGSPAAVRSVVREIRETPRVSGVTTLPSAHGVVLTDVAAQKVKSLLEQEGRDDLRLRVAVQPGGCSGLRYQLFFDERSLDGDSVQEYADGAVRVVVDRMSVPYLAGATIDFVDTIEKQGFTIDNPNAGGSCACGDSFH